MDTMKRLLYVCACFLLCFVNLVKAGPIGWKGPAHEDEEIDKRSISVVPVASHDGGIVSIYFPVQVDYFRVTVKDAIGGVVYTDFVTESSESYIFDINDWASEGDYLLEVEVGGRCFCGDFSL